MKVEYINWGLANFYEDHIEINKGFRENKKLRDYVIQHELNHKKGFDLLHEFDFKLQLFNLFLFIIRHPKTWIDFSPIQYRKKQFIYDINMIALYSMSIILIGILIKIL